MSGSHDVTVLKALEKRLKTGRCPREIWCTRSFSLLILLTPTVVGVFLLVNTILPMFGPKDRFFISEGCLGKLGEELNGCTESLSVQQRLLCDHVLGSACAVDCSYVGRCLDESGIVDILLDILVQSICLAPLGILLVLLLMSFYKLLNPVVSSSVIHDVVQNQLLLEGETVEGIQSVLTRLELGLEPDLNAIQAKIRELQPPPSWASRCYASLPSLSFFSSCCRRKRPQQVLTSADFDDENPT